MMSVNEKLLQAIRARKRKRAEFGYGILTADKHLIRMQDAVGLDCCYRYVGSKQTSFNDLMEKASRTLVYSNPDMELETATSAGDFKSKLDGAPKGFEMPKNTLIVFRHKLTTSTKDRDGDVLHSNGAVVDPKMLLLFNHVHTSPLGPYLFTVSQDGKALRVVSAIVDMNALSHDAAVMVDNKMGRFSHGFRALDFSETKEGVNEEGSGFDVKAFEIMEESLVSVPANPEAETEEVLLSLVSKGKLISPLMKEWGKVLREKRPTTVPGITFKVAEKVGDVTKAQTITCGSFSELKEVVDAGLIGGEKDANKPGGGGGKGKEGETSSSKEADEKAKREESEAGAEEVSFECECIECGFKVKSKKHCRDIECPKCGGEMRRVERPGPGKSKGVYEELDGSWEAISVKLRSLARVALVVSDVDDYLSHVATYADHFIVCRSKDGVQTYQRFQWEIEDGGPVIVSGPEEVIVHASVVLPHKDFTPPDGKPYPNEHSARLRDPGDFEADSFRRVNNKLGPGIHAIFGRLKGETTLTLQAVRFAKDKFDVAEAKAWLKENKFKAIKFEPAKEEGKGLKLGRVLSKANEGKIREARDDIAEATKTEITRPCRALLSSAGRGLTDVISSLGSMGEAVVKPPTVKEATAIVISRIGGVERRRLIKTLQVLNQVEMRNKSLKRFRDLKRSV